MLYKNKNANWPLGKYAAVALFIGCTSLLVASCEREITPSVRNENKTQVYEMVGAQGIVKGADGKPLPGVGVAVEGTTRGTFTDLEGKFKMNVPAGSKLLVKSEGFKEQLIDVNSKYKSVAFVLNMTPGKGRENTRVIGVPAADGESMQATTQASTYNGETIFTVVEQQPEFPGGVQAMYKFLGENIKYPEAAARAGVTGKVFTSFVITKTGELKNIVILKGVGFGIDEEALRVISKMPDWKPGTQDGKPLNVRYRLPIAFEMDSKVSTR